LKYRQTSLFEDRTNRLSKPINVIILCSFDSPVIKTTEMQKKLTFTSCCRY